ncbi:MAG TPA: HupE/UreJ family protein [Variovorax sp.]|nr:HupE/UreJ family protein [Variovorax sp.]
MLAIEKARQPRPDGREYEHLRRTAYTNPNQGARANQRLDDGLRGTARRAQGPILPGRELHGPVIAHLEVQQGQQQAGDVFRPAYLELREAGADAYNVTWKVPAQGDKRLAIDIIFPEGTTQLAEPQGVFSAGAFVEQWRVSRPGGLAGQSLSIAGLAAGVTDVIVRVERQDGTSQVERLLPERTEFIVKRSTGAMEVAWSYLVLGVEHILGGIDHLLFVLALLLVLRGARRIVATITAFTLAHSLTLVAATLGWLHVPGPPVEAMIALSIVFVAAEALHGMRGKPGLTARAPWVVAFTFGLLPGLGFAGALAEVGLPQTAVLVALFMFNVGVELGQLAFVAVLLGAQALLLRSRPAASPAWTRSVLPYAIGTVAMFWVLERVGAFWS